MKKGIIMLLGAIVAQLTFSPLAKGGEDVNIIIVDPTDAGAEVLHRDSAQAPILCTLEEDYLEVTFLSSMGYVSVEIENLTSGEYNLTMINAVIGSEIFPISGNPGTWTITFTLSDGTVYYGAFVI